MRLAYKNGEYYPRSDFQLEVKWGRAETQVGAFARARDIAAALASIAGVTAKVDYMMPSIAVAFDPALESDLGARTAAIEQILVVLDGTGLKYAPLPIVDLVSAPYRDRHPWRDRDVLWAFGPDPVRFERLGALRLPTLAPFFAGTRPVTDPAAFIEFHTGLDAYEQALVRLLAKEGTVLAGRPCDDGCHRPWLEAPAAALVGCGWLKRISGGELAPTPKLAQLNRSAGELLAD